jgi:hypothetical protein
MLGVEPPPEPPPLPGLPPLPPPLPPPQEASTDIKKAHERARLIFVGRYTWISSLKVYPVLEALIIIVY